MTDTELLKSPELREVLEAVGMPDDMGMEPIGKDMPEIHAGRSWPFHLDDENDECDWQFLPTAKATVAIIVGHLDDWLVEKGWDVMLQSFGPTPSEARVNITVVSNLGRHFNFYAPTKLIATMKAVQAVLKDTK